MKKVGYTLYYSDNSPISKTNHLDIFFIEHHKPFKFTSL